MNKIKNKRLELEKTQDEISKALAMHTRQYQYYESDNIEPKVRKAIKIAKALNSTCEELWGEEEKAHTAM